MRGDSNQQLKQYRWTLAVLIVLGLGPQVSDWVHSHMPWWAYRFLAGLLLGMLAAFAYETFKRSIRILRARDFDDLGSNARDRALTIFLYLVTIVLGLVVWFVGWEGENTGWVYGLGVLVGGFLIDEGISSLLRSEETPNSASTRTFDRGEP